MAPSIWRNRGYIPHFDDGIRTQHITFRLADSLPNDAIKRIDSIILGMEESEQKIEKRRLMHEYLDAGKSCCVIKRPEYAQLVQDAILHFDGERYEMYAWVIMPNHVHALLRPLGGWEIRKIISTWKTFTARRIPAEAYSESSGRILRGKAGALRSDSQKPRVWQSEYWDRYIRNDKHFRITKNYIEENPVKAGLCKKPEDWQWSSAAFG